MDDRYAAGLFDGEGFVRISRWRKPKSDHIRYQLIIGIGVTYFPVIHEFQAKYGGSIFMNRHDLRNPKARIVLTLTLASQIAASFLRRVLPHLIIKKDEAELGLELQRHIDETPYNPAGRGHRELRTNGHEITTYREELFQKILALKKRTFPPLLRNGPKVSERSLTR